MTITLKDIAEKANVSISTVSRIINNDETKPASKKTKEKVWKIVREVGYIPNQNARNLIKGQFNEDSVLKTKVIGCILASTKDRYEDPFFSEIARGIQNEAAKHGYLMGYSYSFCDMNESALYNNVIANKVDGAIILGRFSEELLTFLKTNINTLVYAGLNSINRDFDEVICDGYKASCTVMKHFISLGYTEIGYIGSIPGTEKIKVINEHRFDAYRYMLKKYNLQICKKFVKNIDLLVEEGYKAMGDMLKNDKVPQAIFCANDHVAIGVMKAIREEGLHIPEDIAVASIDNIETAAYVRPSLTTINVPREELGKFAVKVLIDRIEGGHDLPVRVNMPFDLVIRESCGAKLKNKDKEVKI